jgi:hypothetical protein
MVKCISRPSSNKNFLLIIAIFISKLNDNPIRFLKAALELNGKK